MSILYASIYSNFYQKVQDMPLESTGCCLLSPLVHSWLLSDLLRIANILLQAMASTSLSPAAHCLGIWLSGSLVS